jgi:ankyrin repeat protein
MLMTKAAKSLLLAVLITVPLCGAEEIHDAVKKGDLAAVQAILDARPDSLKAVNERGYTPLHVAAFEGRLKIASLLIEKGADFEAKNPTGFTPLFLAILGQKPEAVRLLLENGADVNAQTRFQTTPLFSATESGNAQVIRLLIDRGADVNHVSPIFGSALHRAAYMDFPEAARVLLDAGADLKVTDQRGQTPLHQAAQLGRVEIARLFVERGADVNAVDKNNRTPLHWAVLYGTDRSGANNSAELAFLLMEKGARVDTVDAEGETPLMTVVRRGITELAGAFLRRGGNIKAVEPGTGRTLLHLAALNGHADMADLLLARDIDPSAKDGNGKTALDYARQHGNATVALRLVPAIGGMAEPEIGALYLTQPLATDEAYVWSLHNRGWAVKTKSHLFVFDNEEVGRKPDWPSLSNGWISAAEISSQDIVALYSAYHALPNTMEFIHGLENVLPRVTYINYKEDAWRGGTKTRYVKGRETQKVGDVEIIPYETRDSGNMGSLGYLIKVDGLTLFYPNFFPEDIDVLKKEIDFLAGLTESCDLAFIEVTPGQENAQAAYIVEKLKPRVVIPYDRSGDAAQQKGLAEELGKKYPALGFGLVQDAGDRLHYREGKLDRTAR